MAVQSTARADVRRPSTQTARADVPRRLTLGIIVVIVAVLALAPVIYLFWGTFTADGSLSAAAFGRAYGHTAGIGSMIRNSFEFAVGSAIVSMVFGSGLAFLYTRTNCPFKPLIFISSLVPLILPSLLYAVAWILLSSPSIGALNTGIHSIIGARPFNVYSIWGMIWVQGLQLTPVAYLFMSGAFRGFDPSLEQAASASGASWFQTARRVTAPLLRPALIGSFLLIFVQSLESFEIPGILGLNQRIFVFTSQIYYSINQVPSDTGAAGALSIGLLGAALAAFLLSRWALHGSTSGTITGKGFRPRLITLGKGRAVAGAGVLIYFLVAVVLPLLALLYASLLPYYQAVSTRAFKSFSMSNYTSLSTVTDLSSAAKNSLLVGVVTATAVTVIAAAASWFITRARVRGGGGLDSLAFLPIVMPGLILGLATSFIFLHVAQPVYGTVWIFIFALSSRYLPYGMRFSNAAMSQVSRELEEAAGTSGASALQSFRRVMLPLVSGGLVAGWMFVFIFAFRELSAALLLYSPNTQVVPVVMWHLATEGGFGPLAALGLLMVVGVALIVACVYRLGSRLGAIEPQ